MKPAPVFLFYPKRQDNPRAEIEYRSVPILTKEVFEDVYSTKNEFAKICPHVGHLH